MKTNLLFAVLLSAVCLAAAAGESASPKKRAKIPFDVAPTVEVAPGQLSPAVSTACTCAVPRLDPSDGHGCMPICQEQPTAEPDATVGADAAEMLSEVAVNAAHSAINDCSDSRLSTETAALNEMSAARIDRIIALAIGRHVDASRSLVYLYALRELDANFANVNPHEFTRAWAVKELALKYAAEGKDTSGLLEVYWQIVEKSLQDSD